MTVEKAQVDNMQSARFINKINLDLIRLDLRSFVKKIDKKLNNQNNA